MSNDEEDWGPWIEHDGKGCPCRGALVESETRNGNRLQHVAEGAAIWPWGELAPASLPKAGSAWEWADDPLPCDVVRYRIRKPRGLKMLQEIAANPPAKPIRERRPERVLG